MNPSSPAAEPLDILWIGTPGDGQKALSRLVPGIRISAHDEDSAFVVLTTPDVQPDLLLVDASDTAVDALAVLERLRTTSIDLPVVLLAAPSDVLVTRAAQAALCDVVVKTADFVQQLPHAFTQARARHDLAAMFRGSRQTEERLRTILEFQPAVTCLIAPDGSISAINQAGLLLLGGGREQVQGRPITGFVPAAERGGLVDILRRIVAGESLEFDHSIARPDGKTVPVTLRAVPLRSGQAVSVVATIVQRRVQAAPDAATLEALDHALAEVESLRSERAQQRSEQEQRHAKAEIDQVALAAALDDARAKGTAAESALADERVASARQAEMVAAERAQWTAERDQWTTERAQSAQLRTANGELTVAVEQLRGQLAAAEAALATERSASATERAAAAEERAGREQERQQVQLLNQRHDEANATLEDLRARLASTEAALATERSASATEGAAAAEERAGREQDRLQFQLLSERHDEATRTLEDLRTQLESADAALADARTQASSAESALAQTKSQLLAAESTIESERASSTARSHAATEERAQWHLEHERLAQLHAEHTTLAATLADTREQLAFAESAFATERAEWAEQTRLMAAERSEWTREREQLEETRRAHAVLGETLSEVRERLAAAESTLDADRTTQTAERAESERERSEWQAERQSWAIEQTRWAEEREQLAQTKTERDAFAMSIEEVRAQLAAAEAGLAAERATWSAKYAAALGDRAQWAAERQQHDKLQAEYATLSNALDQTRSAVAALEAELAHEREDGSRRDHDARVAHDAIVADRDAERQRAAALSSEVAALRPRIEELETLQRRAVADHESMRLLRRELLRFTTEIENQCRTIIERQEENLRVAEEMALPDRVEPITQ